VELRLRAHRAGVSTRVISGVSALTATAGALGLQVYKFGRTVSIPFPEEGYEPTSPYERLRENLSAGLHTLALLDIREDRCMTAREGIEYLLDCEERLGKGAFKPDTLVCAVARLGSARPVVRAHRAASLLGEDLGPPLHLLVVPGKLHFMEVESLEAFAALPGEVARTLSPGAGPPGSTE
jgi:diphthine synthase